MGRRGERGRGGELSLGPFIVAAMVSLADRRAYDPGIRVVVVVVVVVNTAPQDRDCTMYIQLPD
jgi:hypothetical protein